MKEGNIFIVGRIGDEYDDTGNIKERGVNLIDVITAVRANQSADILNVHINTIGGNVDVSEDIFAYLVSLKPSKKIVTRAYPDPKNKNRGLIASAGVKIFLAGDERTLRKTADDLFIHFPRLDPGVSDAARLQAAAESTAKIESKMITDYATLTGNTVEALQPLMKKQTALSGDEALQLGFATKLIEDKVSVEMILNLNKNEMTLKEQLQAITDSFRKLVVTAEQTAAKEYRLASGKVLMTDADSPDKLIGSSATIEGQPAPDGEHIDVDGNIIVVKGGKVTEFKAKAADSTIEGRVKAIEDGQAKILTALQALTTNTVSAIEAINPKFEDVEKKLRAEIKSGYRIPEVKTDQVTALATEWDASMKNGTIGRIKKEDNAKWQQMYMAKYKVAPKNP